LQFCDRRVCSFQYVETRRLQLRAWPILRTGLRPVQLLLVYYVTAVKLVPYSVRTPYTCVGAGRIRGRSQHTEVSCRYFPPGPRLPCHYRLAGTELYFLMAEARVGVCEL